MNPSEILSSKENIQPLRQGRDASKLSAGLQALNDSEAEKALETQRQKYETLLRDDAVEDPMAIWFDYINWLEQSYPSTCQKSKLPVIVAKCLNRFKDNEKYLNDERFVKICIKYAMMKDTLSMFTILYSNKIGVRCSIFYIAWAEVFTLAEDYKKADYVYQKGIDCLAEPLDDLKIAHRNFQAFLVKKMLDKNTLFEPTSEPLNNRHAYNKLSLRKQGNKEVVPHVRVGEGVTAPGKYSTSKPIVKTKAPVAIYQDGDEEVDFLPKATKMNKVKSHKASLKENVIKPGVWTKPENRNAKFAVSEVKMPFSVHEDEGAAEKIEEPVGKLTSALKPKVVDEFNVDFTAVPLFCAEPHDPTKKAMFCKEKVYAGGIEFQFEELRAMAYLRRQRLAASEDCTLDKKQPTIQNGAEQTKTTKPALRESQGSVVKPRVIYDSGRKSLKCQVTKEARSARRKIALDCPRQSTGSVDERRSRKSSCSISRQDSLPTGGPAVIGLPKVDVPSDSFINQTIHTKEAVNEMQELWFAKPATPLPVCAPVQNFAVFVDDSCTYATDSEPPRHEQQKPEPQPFSVYVDESCLTDGGKLATVVTTKDSPPSLPLPKNNVPCYLDVSPLQNNNKENSAPSNYDGLVGKSNRPVTGVLTPSNNVPYEPMEADIVEESEDDDEWSEAVANTTGVTETCNFTQAFQRITHASTPNVRQSVPRKDVQPLQMAPLLDKSNEEVLDLRNCTETAKKVIETKPVEVLAPPPPPPILNIEVKNLSVIVETSREYKSSSSCSSASTYSKLLPVTPGESHIDAQKRLYYSQADDSRKTPFLSKTPGSSCYEASNELSRTGPRTRMETNDRGKPLEIVEEEVLTRAFGDISLTMVNPTREDIDPFCEAVIDSLLEKINFPTAHHVPGFFLHDVPLPNIKINSTLPLDNKTFSVKKLMGEGAYAKVFKVQNLTNKEWKVVKYQKPPAPWEFYIAREIRERCTKPEMRDFFMNVEEGHFFQNASLLLSVPVEYGNLLSAINSYRSKQGDVMSDYLATYFTVQILEIIEVLHSCDIIHGDIKPDNFLVKNVGGELKLVLIDFGRSIDMRLFPANTKFTRVVTTEGFTCVEMQTGRPWTYQLDLYGVAACVHCLLFGDYMKVAQKNGVWDIARLIPRYLAKKGWKNLFEKFLNIPSCTELPSIAELRSEFREKLTAYGPRSDLIKLTNFLQNH